MCYRPHQISSSTRMQVHLNMSKVCQEIRASKKSSGDAIHHQSSSGTVKPIQLRIQKDPPVAPDTSQTFDKELPSSKSSSVKNKENSGEGVSRSERLKSKPTPVAPEFQVWPLSTAFSHNLPFYGSDRNILMTPTG